MLPPGYACGQVVPNPFTPAGALAICKADAARRTEEDKEAAKRKESSDKEKSASQRQRSSGDEDLQES